MPAPTGNGRAHGGGRGQARSKEGYDARAWSAQETFTRPGWVTAVPNAAVQATGVWLSDIVDAARAAGCVATLADWTGLTTDLIDKLVTVPGDASPDAAA